MKLKLPEGKYMGPVQIDEEGRIPIPAEVRELFSLQSGDTLLFLADQKKGMALQRGAK